MTERICNIPGCGKRHFGGGWCAAHHRRWRRHGSPTGGGTSYGDPELYFSEVVLPYQGDECLPWPFAKRKGYGRLARDGRDLVVSRLVCEAEHGPPPSIRHQAAHACGNGHKGCVTRRHLSWKTPEENNADKLIHGTHHRGERYGAVKLTEASVLQIRALRGRRTQAALARDFGVSRGTIKDVQLRKSWAWLEAG